MTQAASIYQGSLSLKIELPEPHENVIPGVAWGRVEAFPSPAYWKYQVLARRLLAPFKTHRLGRTFPEEVVACLLGGYGMPATVGKATFQRLQRHGLLGKPFSEETLYEHLRMPVAIAGREVHYRFARQKARYISEAIRKIELQQPPMHAGGRALRDWLLELHGVGPKTASWIARNWLDADDVAILDVHILKVGQLTKVFWPSAKISRDYVELESRFLSFSHALEVRPSELDAVIWSEMSASRATLRRLSANQ